MNNLINWFEIPVTDMERASAFYESVMSVTLRRETVIQYQLAIFPHQKPATGGALVKFDGIAPSSQGIIIYLQTPQLAVTLERIAQAGGTCLSGPSALPDGLGTIALFTDCEGNRIGLHQPE